MSKSAFLGTITLRQMLNAVYNKKNPLYSRGTYSECGGIRLDFEEDPSLGDEVVYVYYNRKKDRTIMSTAEGDFDGWMGSSAGFEGKVELCLLNNY